MAGLMLLMCSRSRLRGRVIRAMASQPGLFTQMLAMHVGELSPMAIATSGLSLGVRMLTV